MGKLAIRLIIILSVSINISFAIHFFTSTNDNSKENPLELNLTVLQKSQLKKIRLKSHRENDKRHGPNFQIKVYNPMVSYETDA